MGNGTSVTEYDCAGCGVTVHRAPTKGQRPKWCADCRASNVRLLNTFTCAGCGETVTSSGRKYCSQLCRVFVTHGPRVCKWAPPKPARIQPVPFTPEARECAWCGAQFTARIRTQTFCTSDHKIKAKRNRRRGRQYGSTSHFTWAEFMRLYAELGRRCAYCDQAVGGQPDPDHVVPLSKGGSNSITNILPSCRACNSDKRDLLLAEWAVDRERRGLPPRSCVVSSRWRHLTDALLSA